MASDPQDKNIGQGAPSVPETVENPVQLASIGGPGKIVYPYIKELPQWIKTLSGATFFLLFTLYVLGSIILSSYFGKFGLSSSFIPYKCVSAALCYVLFVIAVGVPFWLILEFVYNRLKTERKQAAVAYLTAMAIIWDLVLGQFETLYFPDQPVSRHHSLMDWTWIIFGISIIILFSLHSYNKLPKRLSDYRIGLVFVVLYMAVVLIGFYHLRDVSGIFVSDLGLLYSTLFIMPGFQLAKLREQLSKRELQTMLVVFGVFVIGLNASDFGKNQYYLISPVAGGGKPEVILFRSEISSTVLASKFHLPVTDGMIGPVFLLFSSDKDFCVISTDSFNSNSREAVTVRRDLVDLIVNVPPDDNSMPPASPGPAASGTSNASSMPSASSTPSGKSTPTGKRTLGSGDTPSPNVAPAA